ncbi:hypothetical protein PBCVCVM1_876R [Paramecium bursaria Chlorella virus CVM-1]|nr:hypothetical protein PBCVCVM1_876R [Paramecium bursaria Chlorella virus CVM-1]
METDKTQCSNCKVWRDKDTFIGKKGNVVKRCLKCREKDDKQKKRPDVVVKRNERQREKKYYQTYRNKKREEDKQGFTDHNTSNQRLSVSYRLCALKHSANKRNIVIEETDDNLEIFMKEKCYYCDYMDLDYSLNGIDRLDSSTGYTKSNCVPCCSTCNYMKKCLDPLTFIQRCIQISSGVSFDNIWRNYKGCPYLSYKSRALEKKLVFELSKTEFDNLQKGNCFYCRRMYINNVHTNGIDRKDNTIGYSLDNCVSCCGDCNYSKGKQDRETFERQCKLIANKNTIVPQNIVRNFDSMKRI